VPQAGLDPARRIERNIRAMNTRWRLSDVSEFFVRPLRPFRLDAANISIRCPEQAPLIWHTFKRLSAVFF
jgi:hypothetical protein